MTPEPAARWKQVKQLFAAALERAPPLRAAFLAEACGEDAALRGEVEALLVAHHDAGTFLDSGGGTNRLATGISLGPYEIVELIGGGGMGQVYRAKDARLGREVAIKVISSGKHHEQALQRFAVEARAAGSINHPNILAIYDVGTYEGGPYLVSELLKGKTLREVLNGKPLPLLNALDYAIQLAQGLSAAHDHGVVHRDLKPENLFITNEGRVKILDFGIAKLVAEGTPAEASTLTGSVVGTVGYISPEQLRGERADERSDIFAFGVVLHEMLGGQLAFKRNTPVETGNAILNEEPRELPDSVPLELKRLVLRCLQKKPQDRVQSAHDIAAQLGTIRPIATASTALFAELKRRRVFRALIAYGIAAFAILQIIEPIMHGLHWPEAVLSYVVVALALGFPFVVGLAWVFDVNAGRIERTAPAVNLRRARVVPLLVGMGLLAGAPGVLYYFVLRHGGRVVAGDAAAKKRSIAVLPFASLSDEDHAYFAEGMHDELLRQLSRIGDLSVISRTSVLQYKEGARNIREIGETLGVSSIVEGTVQRIGNRVRVQAKLVDAQTDRQIWSDRYDREMTDVFAIEAEVAEEIAGALKVQLSSAEKAEIVQKPTENLQAYDFYLQARVYEPQEGGPSVAAAAERSERFYRRAIELDPTFALAHAHLAELLLNRYYYASGTPDSVAQEAKDQADEAVRLQPNLPASHVALGLYHYFGKRDYDRALKEFELARPGDPNVALRWISFIERRQGKFDEAIRKQEQDARLNPLNATVHYQLSMSFYRVRRYEEATHAIDRALTIKPDSDIYLARRAFLPEVWHGQADSAKAYLRTLAPRLRKIAVGGGERDHSLILDDYGHVLVELLLDNPREALAVLDTVTSKSFTTILAVYPTVFLFAEAHSALGEGARARLEYETARPQLEALVSAHPGKAFQRSLLALAFAGLGRKEDALREARRAVELLPLSKDAFLGPFPLMDLAIVEARVGETSAAIDRVRYLLSIPSPLSPGLLRIDPRWNPLRNDLRFRKLAELEPIEETHKR